MIDEHRIAQLEARIVALESRLELIENTPQLQAQLISDRALAKLERTADEAIEALIQK